MNSVNLLLVLFMIWNIIQAFWFTFSSVGCGRPKIWKRWDVGVLNWEHNIALTFFWRLSSSLRSSLNSTFKKSFGDIIWDNLMVVFWCTLTCNANTVRKSVWSCFFPPASIHYSFSGRLVWSQFSKHFVWFAHCWSVWVLNLKAVL